MFILGNLKQKNYRNHTEVRNEKIIHIGIGNGGAS